MKDTIPRLIDLEYLIQGLALMGDSATFEELRLQLINVSRRRAESQMDIPRSGYSVVRRLNVVDDYTYWSNAKDVLIELINLNLVVPAPVPSKRNYVAQHRNRRYVLTESGRTLLEKLKQDESLFRDQLLELMYRRHGHLRDMIKVLERNDIFIPIYRLTGRFDDPHSVDDKSVIHDAVVWLQQKVEGLALPSLDLGKLWRKLADKARNGQGMPKTNLVDAINENIERDVIGAYGLTFDNVTFDHLCRLSQQMHITNYGYLQDEGAAKRVIFSTAEIQDEPVFTIKRHKISDYEEKIINILPTEIQSIGGPFIPIYHLRTLICHRLKINNEVFDYVVQRIYAGEYDIDYQIILLRDMPGLLPPSAYPLRVGSELYFKIALVRKKEAMS